jgi:glycosyltransferase involved in cell wall biosynthesis
MGIVIDPDNVAQLQEAMLTLISDPDLTKKYAAEGNKFAVKELDWNLNTKHLYEEMKKRNLQN